ncbi:hypothetical protein AAF712_005214 [Marasmius tenuissimus]|uniref:Secreted protein n=1 Tax=Marasmius tenuissimus TaxID=585030 RepID=A0ABR3A345_9AGAR|nr:hypothetical protein PM082_022487 [Marasmius tenuissimus]
MRLTTASISLVIATALQLIPSASAEVGIHCGTTKDATFSDCKSLIEDESTWNAAFNTANTCSYLNPWIVPFPQTAYNVACKGNCCVYVAGYESYDISRVDTRRQAQGLLGCADTGKDKINAMQKFDDGHGVCISNGSGCGDCFDDRDFLN